MTSGTAQQWPTAGPLLPARATQPAASSTSIEEMRLRILGHAIAFAGIFVVSAQCSIAAELLAPCLPVAEAVDDYLDQTLRKEGVKPAPAADDAALLRRLTLDL